MKLLLGSAAAVGMIAMPAQGASNVTAGDRGLTVKSGSLELNLGGRAHFDASVFDLDERLTYRTAAKVRRARLELSGKLGKRVRFEVDREFAGRSKGWRNVWLQVEPARKIAIRAGNFVAPFSMERLESSNTNPFVERSLASALTPGYGLGGSISASGRRWTASAGWFDDPLGNEDASAERGRGVVGRATFVPLKGKRRLGHVGLSLERRSFDAPERLRFSADPGSVLAPTLISSGSIDRLQSMFAWNGEASLALGPLLFQGEATGLHLSRARSDAVNFTGQLVQASWMITGEQYDYSPGAGLFTGPHLKRGKRAVELALRYSRLDMDSERIRRGTAIAITSGANWYFNRNVRLMFDYTYARKDLPEPKPDKQDHVGVVRFQLSY